MISKMEISSLKDYLETNEESEPRIAKVFLEDVISMFEEIQQYRAIGTVEECREAREKQRGKKPILSAPCKSINYYICPDCGEILRINRPFCSKCGSAMDWSDTP